LHLVSMDGIPPMRLLPRHTRFYLTLPPGIPHISTSNYLNG